MYTSVYKLQSNAATFVGSSQQINADQQLV